MKKWLSLGIVLSMCIMLLSGCKEEEPTEILYYNYDSTEVADALNYSLEETSRTPDEAIQALLTPEGAEENQEESSEESSEVVEVQQETSVVEESSEVMEESSEENSVEESSVVEKEDSEEEQVEEVIEADEPEDEGEFFNPLTGEVVEEDMSLLRPYVFMCNNNWDSFPQLGISEAEWIIEFPEESHTTRMMAFFLHPENVEAIGPIRSCTPYNLETALGYDAILVHYGATDSARTMINDYTPANLDEYNHPELFNRDMDRYNAGKENVLFVNGEDAVDAVDEEAYYRSRHTEEYDSTYGLSFSRNAVKQCDTTAQSIEVTYDGGKTTNFEYDSLNKTYTMYEFENEYMDGTDTSVSFANVLTLFANTEAENYSIRLSIDLSGGDGYFFTKGRCVAIKWYKDGVKDCFHFTLEDGTPLTLSVGKTFINVLETGDTFHGTVEFQ